jgi:purine-nucleoside/S-methyl-5'-thioadenosine phosphorylase / adenosine deaminase
VRWAGVAGGWPTIQTVSSRAATTTQIRQRGGLEVLAWPAFGPYAVDVMVTTRHGGVSGGGYATLNLSFSVGDDPANVAENRGRVAAALPASITDFVFAAQVHGRRARIVSRADRGRGAMRPDDALADTDALVTGDPGTVLAILVADCVPIVLYDPAAHVVACVHAGWRGTVAGVTRAALDAMATLGASPQTVIAALGPGIDPGSYQVAEDVAAAVRRALPGRTSSVLRPDGTGRWLFDVAEANRLLLRDAGVPAGQIHQAGVATGPGSGLFFSHRATRPCGRFAAVARLGRGGGL